MSPCLFFFIALFVALWCLFMWISAQHGSPEVTLKRSTDFQFALGAWAGYADYGRLYRIDLTLIWWRLSCIWPVL